MVFSTASLGFRLRGTYGKFQCLFASDHVKRNVMMKKLRVLIGASLICFPLMNVQAATIGFADVVLDFFDSGAGPIAGSYGGTFPGGPGFPIPVSTDVVLGDDPGSTGFTDFLSLPTGSFVTVGFTDETVIDGVGDDFFITEVSGQGEEADVFVSSNSVDFTFIGRANDGISTAFDLASIGFLDPVQAIKIVGLDSLGGSPGFDVVNIKVLPGSIGPAPVPVPAAVWLFGSGLIGLLGVKKNKATLAEG